MKTSTEKLKTVSHLETPHGLTDSCCAWVRLTVVAGCIFGSAQQVVAQSPLSAAAARKPAESFRFAIQADSHLDYNTNTNLYIQTLKNIASTKPDFLMDMGDTFMTGKLPSLTEAEVQYRTQRTLFDLAGCPAVMVLGNHDGEEQKRGKGGVKENRAEWSLAQRKKYFPNPQPDGFFTGNSDGKQDYVAWTWGDALFVVLSPYWYSYTRGGVRDPWAFTLGDAQYAWLKKTLESSKAPFKFIFIHQLTGSIDSASRGGVEAAKLHEWGDTSAAFKQHRPNWPLNIHQLLRENKVTIVFHGHDHFYAREELDGVIYQLVPQPGATNNKKTFEEYGYKEGVFYPSSGFLSVDVSSTNVNVSYLRSATPGMERPGMTNLSVTHQYHVERK
jgi:predicted phosphodiesterase